MTDSDGYFRKVLYERESKGLYGNKRHDPSHASFQPSPLPNYEIAETLCPGCLLEKTPVARCFKARCAAAWAKDGKERKERERMRYEA